MKVEAFLLIFLCIISDSCFAVECPVRAIFAPTPEVDVGYGCVCRPGFYGDKCQFQAQNRSALEVDASWRKNNNARVTWMSEYDRQFHLSVRRVNFDSTGTFFFGKWRKAVIHFIAIRMETPQAEDGTDRATYSAHIGLMKDLSYQIRLVEMSPDGSNLTASVFLDAREELAVDAKSDQNNIANEEKSCSWYACSAHFFTEILNDAGIFAAPIIVFGMLLIGILIYVVIRQCTCRKQHRDINVEKPTVVGSVENRKKGVTKLHEISNEDLPEIVVCTALTNPVFIEIPEILITASLSEVDSQSESSAEESSSDEGEYIVN